MILNLKELKSRMVFCGGFLVHFLQKFILFNFFVTMFDIFQKFPGNSTLNSLISYSLPSRAFSSDIYNKLSL